MQRRYIFAAVVLVAVVLLISTGVLTAADKGSQKSIEWSYNFDKAAKEAKKQAKPMMVDFYTDWCGWCKRLDRDVYTKDNVVALSKQFVCIKLNPEKDQENGKKFSVEGFPTIVFTNSEGKEIHRIVGYKPADKFAAEMKKALEAAKGKEPEKEKPKE